MIPWKTGYNLGGFCDIRLAGNITSIEHVPLARCVNQFRCLADKGVINGCQQRTKYRLDVASKLDWK